MRFEPKYNRLRVLDFYDEDWIIDRNGNLIMKEDNYRTYNDSIPMQTIRFDEKT